MENTFRNISKYGQILEGILWATTSQPSETKILPTTIETTPNHLHMPWLLRAPFGKVISGVSNSLFYPETCSGFCHKADQFGKSNSNSSKISYVPTTTLNVMFATFQFPKKLWQKMFEGFSWPNIRFEPTSHDISKHDTKNGLLNFACALMHVFSNILFYLKNVTHWWLQKPSLIL